MVSSFFVGKGIDLSKKKQINCANHHFVEPNNLYRFNKKEYDSYDFVYSKDIINSSKFYKILLKEWFWLCRVGGYIIIEFKENKHFKHLDLINEINSLLGEDISFIEKNSHRIVIKKLKPSLAKGDDINKWTFGIITNGSNEDYLDNQIKSILDLKIRNCEIIVCGKYGGKYRKKITLIPFNYEVPWITRKKNLIAKHAKYENLVIAHNRFIFDKNWFKGMRKYGNNFEVLSCVIRDESLRRAADWVTYGYSLESEQFNRAGLLEYRDWDRFIVINGGFYILKKRIWKKCPWNESLVWGNPEDNRLSLDFHKSGVVPRFNPFSKVRSFGNFNARFCNWSYSFNSKRLGKRLGLSIFEKCEENIRWLLWSSFRVYFRRDTFAKYTSKYRS